MPERLLSANLAKNLDPEQTCVGAILSTESKPREGAADDITPGAATLLEDTPVDSAIRFHG